MKDQKKIRRKATVAVITLLMGILGGIICGVLSVEVLEQLSFWEQAFIICMSVIVGSNIAVLLIILEILYWDSILINIKRIKKMIKEWK